MNFTLCITLSVGILCMKIQHGYKVVTESKLVRRYPNKVIENYQIILNIYYEYENINFTL